MSFLTNTTIRKVEKQAVVQPVASEPATHAHPRRFQRFAVDNDGQLNEEQVAALLMLLTKKKNDDDPKAQSVKAPGTHGITIDGQTLSLGEGEFDLLFKQPSNL